MRSIHYVATALAVAFLSACGGGSNGTTSPLPGTSTGAGPKTSSSSVTTQTYTLNPVPAGSGPSLSLTDYSVPQYPSSAYGLTMTTDGAVWWEADVVVPGAAMIRMQGGKVTAIPAAGANSSGSTMGATPNGRAWGDFEVGVLANGGSVPFLFYATANSAQAQPQPGFNEPQTTRWLATSQNGNIWYVGPSADTPPFGSTGSFVGYVDQNATSPQGDHQLNLQTANMSAVTAGPDGAMWTGGFDASGNFAFYRYSNTLQFLGEVKASKALQAINAMVTGPDKAIWFTDPSDNVIGRVTTSGAVTTYSIPSAASDPEDITLGGDGALWFTERAQYKLGRISTSGTFSEYALPIHGIIGQLVGPNTSGCGGSQLWFPDGSDIEQVTIEAKTSSVR